MKLSKRISNITPSAIVKYDSMIEIREKNGIKFIRANIGQPDFKTNISYYNGLKTINTDSTNSYTCSEGLRELREKVAFFYNDYFKKQYVYNDVIITQGASDGLIKLLFSICDVNDEVIVIEPFFSDYKIYADMLGIKLKSIKYNDFNSDDLYHLLSLKTKAILFSNPNNPNGDILQKRYIELLIKFARKNDIYIISDEVYSGLLYDDSFFSLANFDDKNIIIVDSASKKFNVCGSRIGFILSKSKKIINSISILNDSKISISRTEQYAITKMFDNYTKIIDENKNIYKNRMKKMCGLLDRYKIKYIYPKAGVSFLIELPINNCEEYILWVIEKYSLKSTSFVVTPAKDFYLTAEGNNKIRVTLTIEEDQMEFFVFMLQDSLKKFREESGIK